MPDHVHLVLVGESDRADLISFMKLFKQKTGYAYRQSHGCHLWQAGYYEHVLRDDEATEGAMRYTLENPIRAGLSRAIGEYPFAGSGVYEMGALIALWQKQARRPPLHARRTTAPV